MPKRISVLVIEEEKIYAQKIVNDLNQFGFKKIKVAGTFDGALKAIHDNDFNIAILDIFFNGKPDGIELSKVIGHTYGKPFIFISNIITADIIQGTDVTRPSAFLTRSFTAASLLINIKSAIHYHQSSPVLPANGNANYNDFFFVKLGNKYKKLLWQNVVCLQSQKNYTSIITGEQESYLVRSSLQNTINKIIPEEFKHNFVQINRGEVLQIGFIEEIIGDEVKIARQYFNITDAYVKNFKQKLNIVL